jgi:hypothetical protein
MKTKNYYYEIVRSPDRLTLFGPIEGIKRVKPFRPPSSPFDSAPYHFAQVLQGKIMAAFTKADILISKKVL